MIDRAVFDEFLESMGADFAAELVETFLQEAPGMLNDLRAAEAACEDEAFRRAAHSIKSNAAIFGAEGLAAAARTLELEGPQAGGVEAVEAALAEASVALTEALDG